MAPSMIFGTTCPEVNTDNANEPARKPTHQSPTSISWPNAQFQYRPARFGPDPSRRNADSLPPVTRKLGTPHKPASSMALRLSSSTCIQSSSAASCLSVGQADVVELRDTVGISVCPSNVTLVITLKARARRTHQIRHKGNGAGSFERIEFLYGQMTVWIINLVEIVHCLLLTPSATAQSGSVSFYLEEFR